MDCAPMALSDGCDGSAYIARHARARIRRNQVHPSHPSHWIADQQDDEGLRLRRKSPGVRKGAGRSVARLRRLTARGRGCPSSSTYGGVQSLGH